MNFACKEIIGVTCKEGRTVRKGFIVLKMGCSSGTLIFFQELVKDANVTLKMTGAEYASRSIEYSLSCVGIQGKEKLNTQLFLAG